MARIDWGDVSFPTCIEEVVPGDMVCCSWLPQQGGVVKSVGSLLGFPALLIEDWAGEEQVLPVGNIRVLGVHGVEF